MTRITIKKILFLFTKQVAVPKSFTLQMLSPSGTELPPGGNITQEMRITSNAKVCALLYRLFCSMISNENLFLGCSSYETAIVLCK